MISKISKRIVMVILLIATVITTFIPFAGKSAQAASSNYFICLVDYWNTNVNVQVTNSSGTVVDSWKESIIGTSNNVSGWAYCADPTQKFWHGTFSGTDATTKYGDTIVKKMGALMYWSDTNITCSMPSHLRYALNTSIVWNVLNKYSGNWASGWYYAGKGQYDYSGCNMTTHINDLYSTGWKWMENNWQDMDVSATYWTKWDSQPVITLSYKYNPSGYLSLKKKSADSGLTSGNSNYSLAGAEYGVYSSKTLSGSSRVGTLTVKADGTANTLKLTRGTYYVYEITAPKGYVKDTTIYTATVGARHTSVSPNVISVTEKPITGKINLQKTSSMPECTDGNNLYSLAGAEYSVYKDASCTQYVDKMVTDEEGKASLSGLPLNKYWVKETKVPDGYTIDPKVYAVDLSSGTDAVVTGTVESKDTPIMDPAAILLFKVDKETGGAAQNNGTLGGAQFEVKFYDVISDTDPALNGEKPLRTWIFETDEDGFLQYDTPFLVSGDELFINTETGIPSLPYGPMTFKEVKAPEGYLLDNTIIVKRTDGYGTPGIVYQTPTQEEDDLEMRITKVDATTGKPVPGVVFEHTMPDGTKEQYTTDENGFIDISCLEYGTHKLKEKSVPDGFAVNTAEIEFKVAKDNSITVVKGDAAETDTNGKVSVEVADDGCIEVRMENKAAPYKVLVHKTNEDSKVLAGAEFTLYSDASCKKVITKGTTNSKGELYFNNLIVGTTYYMKETKAPEGYRIPVNADGSDIVFKLQADSKVMNDEFTFIVNNKSYTADEGTYCVTGTKADRVCEMTVLNYTTQQLPETGSHNTLILIGAGIALVTVAGVIALKCRKR